MATTIHDALSGGGGGARPPVLHCLAAAVLGIGVFALAVGAGPAFATHVSDVTLHVEDTLADTSSTLFALLDTLDTIK